MLLSNKSEPYPFTRRDLENPDPFVKEILETGQ